MRERVRDVRDVTVLVSPTDLMTSLSEKVVAIDLAKEISDSAPIEPKRDGEGSR